ncbi:MAG TPA: hypothetical protein ENJ11_07795 [Gammaproteobacteria bacterium]|nr:hypothetical protein [Gammaproteobacteria bacterium]
MSGSWGCPHERKGRCARVRDRACDPGMKGCVLYGRFAFSNNDKNSPSIRRKLQAGNRSRKQ